VSTETPKGASGQVTGSLPVTGRKPVTAKNAVLDGKNWGGNRCNRFWEVYTPSHVLSGAIDPRTGGDCS